MVSFVEESLELFVIVARVHRGVRIEKTEEDSQRFVEHDVVVFKRGQGRE